MVFQDFVLFPHMTVAENIAYGIRGLKSDRQKRVLELLDLVSLSHLSDQMPHQISGGEQQRVALARSLAPRPQLILMDEPFSNLDHQLRVQLRPEIHGILKHEGVPTILVTHDQSEAITFSDQMVLMNREHWCSPELRKRSISSQVRSGQPLSWAKPTSFPSTGTKASSTPRLAS